MNILIVSTFFPPQNSIASHRPYSWAKWWSRDGHNVTVLTTTKCKTEVDMDFSFEGFTVESIDIPFITARQKARQVAAISESQVNGKIGKKQNSWVSTCVQKLASHTGILNSTRFPDLSELWVSGAKKYALAGKWDLVVTTGGPYTVHRIGYAIKLHSPNTKWILDWRDLWTNNHMFKGIPIIRWYEKYLEKKFHSVADVISTVSDPLANVISRDTQTKTITIYNGIDEEDYIDLDEKLFFPCDETLRIVYAGTIYKGKRDPSPLFDAINKLRKEHNVKPEQLQVYFAGPKSHVSQLIKDYSLSEYCRELGLLSRQDSLRMQRDADILLFLEHEAPNVDGILTGKLFEYLHAKKFILGVGVTLKSETGRLIEGFSPGVVCGLDSEKIKITLIRLLGLAGSNFNFDKKVDHNYLAEFNRKVGAKRLLNSVFK